jgi:Flp pilus assembly protein TadG
MNRHDNGNSDDGTVLILMIFFALIIAAVVTAVIDVSTVFLAQRQLQSTADGAALVAAQQTDTSAVYAGRLGSAAALVPAQVQAAAIAYAIDPSRIPHNCTSSSYQVIQAAVGVDGQTATVTLACRVPLPFVGVVASLWSDGVPITETANARAAVTPLG